MKRYIFVLFTLYTTITAGQSSIITPSPSPQQTITMSLGDDQISVDYSRIRLRGRQFFGEGSSYIFPYGKTWRTGANSGSKITFTKDVMISGKILSKGSYVLLSWPGKNKWEISFYKDLEIRGAVEKYDTKNDALKISVIPQLLSKTVETMTITLNRTAINEGLIQLALENTLLQIPFIVTGGNNSENTSITTTQ